jgi:hypothetical protein
MAALDLNSNLIDSVLNRRSFVTGLGAAGLGAAAASMLGCSNNMTATAPVAAAAAGDTAAQILTAALIAESLAITTYYTALNTSAVITDPNLAGPGGTAINVTSGSQINVAYLQGALLEEVSHAQLLRTLLGLKTGTFSSLMGFVPTLLALESAFIGAYMIAVEEFSSMAAGYNGFSATQVDPSSSTKANLAQSSLILYAKVAASILGVESEHRALVRGIPAVTLGSPNYAGINLIPANNLNYESTDGLIGELVSIGGGTTNSAGAALGPFIASGTSGFTVTVPTAANMASFSSVVNASVMSNTTGSIPAAQ